MTYITVDARECGAGKTRGANGIFDRISDNLANKQKTIIAVPSIILMKEYKEYFAIARCVSSETSSNVQQELHYAMSDTTPIIIITHKALLDSEIPYLLRKSFDLIIDEAIDPWRMHIIEQDSDDRVFDWEKFISIPLNDAGEKEFIDDKYDLVEFNNLLTNSITRESTMLRDLTSYNWIHYVDQKGLEKLVKKENTKLSVFSELDPLLFRSWGSVHVAAAFFSKTFMAWWFKKNKMKYNETRAFNAHQIGLTVHYPDHGDGGFEWTKNRKTTMAWLQAEFYDYVKQQVGNNPLLRLKNKDDAGGICTYEEILPHNTAGMNKWRHYEHVMLESSLNPSPELDAWYRHILHNNNVKRIDQDEIIFAARTGYIYYQTLMRSCLRAEPPKPAIAYAIDKRVIPEMVDYFGEYQIIPWVPVGFQVKREKKKKTSTKVALSDSERKKISRAKQRDPERYMGMNSREILNELLLDNDIGVTK